ncbi:MAG TPA: hypothetical protein VMC79_12775, partial [Rectinemataceae bacterium]|nr:hypothetical protein [Rectinemataceae bacterium]
MHVRRSARFLPLFLLAFGLTAGTFAASPAPGAPAGPQGFPQLLEAVRACGPRLENSASERACFDLIESVCRGSGLSPRSIPFGESSEGYSYSRIIEARLSGGLPDELAIIVPVDEWVDAEPGQDGASGIALALAGVEEYGAAAASGQAPALSLRFVFLGAERRGPRSSGEEAALGTKTWLSRAELGGKTAVLYLSTEGLPEGFALENAGGGILSPLWHYDRIRRSLESAGFPLRLEANRMQLYRLGLADSYGPAAAYLSAGIPAVDIRGQGTAPESEKVELGVQFSTFLRELVRANQQGFSDTWDRHYLIFQLGSVSAVVREPVYVAFLVAFSILATAGALILSITRRDALKAAAHRVPIIAGQLFILFVSLCILLSVERARSTLDAFILGSPDFWRLTPRVFAASTLLSSFLLFLAFMSLLVERRILTPNPYFYEFAALLCLALDILVFTAIRLPLSFYFVWAFLVVAVSLALRKPSATLLAYVIMYAPLLLLVAELSLRPELSLYGRVISPGVGASLVLAATTLPFFTFAASPLLFYSKRGAAARSRAALLFSLAALLVEAASLGNAAVIARRARLGDWSLAQGAVSETFDQDSSDFTTSFRADCRVGTARLLRGGSSLILASATSRAVQSGHEEQRFLEVQQRHSSFLDRVTDSIAVDSAQPPYSIELQLDGGVELQIYDCDLPYTVALDGRRATIFTGINPGSHFSFSLTVPRSFAATLSIRAHYLHPLVPYVFPDGSRPADGSFMV